MVQSAEGTRAVALELCREFEDKFLAHITSGKGSGWKIVASFEGKFPDRIKQLPLDRHFDLNNMKRIVLEADGYQPYLISPEKGLRSLKKGVLEKAKEPSRLCVEEVHRVLLDIVNAAANATPGLGRYPPFKREVIAIASNALDAFKIDAKKMVVALVDMERAFVPPQHFIRLVQRRMERQRREDELKNNRASKKGQDAEQFKMNRVTLKRSAKNNEWSKRWFVLNEKSGKLGYTKKQEERHFRGVIVLEECNLVEIEEEEISKSSKDSKKANGQDKGPSLVFKITNRVAYKSVLKSLFLYVIWGDTMTRRPADPEEELRWMSQEVRGYVEAVLNSFAANVPKALVLCQVEKSKEDMLNQLYSSISAQSNAKIEELLQEDHNAKQSSPRSPGHSGEDWKSAFNSAANVSVNGSSSQHETRSRSADRGRRHENGDATSGSRRTPNRLPPAPPSGGRY
ncbi:Dynamin-2A [Zea mays]|uniref:Dynamin-2A n=1 Tax=Zea mays TaxID=4577 RepID=A0A3L6F4U5_MAIZE|nr:Dynamin-2A [Zea mays]